LHKLIHAINNNNINNIKNIIDNNRFAINFQNNDGLTPLMIAIQNENKEIIELILSKNPDVNIRDINGMTALIMQANMLLIYKN